MDLKTIGLSPKAVLAFVFPAVAALLTSAASWAESGEFSTTEIRAAVGGIVLSGIALLGAYVGRPGVVAPEPDPRAGERGQYDPINLLVVVIVVIILVVLLLKVLDRV